MSCYLAQLGAIGPVKIGWSATVQRRLDQISSGLWEDVHLLRLFAGDAVTESLLHKRFAHLRIRGEWFHYHPDMMGDVGFADIVESPPLPTIDTWHSGDAVRVACSTALSGWMTRVGIDERRLAAAVGAKPSSVVEWLTRGRPPRLRTQQRLIEMSDGELAPAFAAFADARRAERKAA